MFLSRKTSVDLAVFPIYSTEMDWKTLFRYGPHAVWTAKLDLNVGVNDRVYAGDTIHISEFDGQNLNIHYHFSRSTLTNISWLEAYFEFQTNLPGAFYEFEYRNGKPIRRLFNRYLHEYDVLKEYFTENLHVVNDNLYIRQFTPDGSRRYSCRYIKRFFDILEQKAMWGLFDYASRLRFENEIRHLLFDFAAIGIVDTGADFQMLNQMCSRRIALLNPQVELYLFNTVEDAVLAKLKSNDAMFIST